MVKKLPANAEVRGACLSPGLGRSPGGGHGVLTPVHLPREFHGQSSHRVS